MPENRVDLARGVIRCVIVTPDPLPASAYRIVADLVDALTIAEQELSEVVNPTPTPTAKSARSTPSRKHRANPHGNSWGTSPEFLTKVLADVHNLGVEGAAAERGVGVTRMKGWVTVARNRGLDVPAASNGRYPLVGVAVEDTSGGET